MAPSRKYWWNGNSCEKYWCEITGRPDIGGDLKCPQADESGKPYWSYSLIKEIRPGDFIFHYSTTDRAIVGASVAVELAKEGEMEWTARGTAARKKLPTTKSRPAWTLQLDSFTASASPFTLQEIEEDEKWVRAWIAERQHDRPLCVPVQPYPRRLRAYQGYLTKMPADFVDRWPGLRDLVQTMAAEAAARIDRGIGPDAAMEVLAQEVEPELRSQGFLGSAELRRAVEDHAMKMARSHFDPLGYRVAVLGKPYDLRCSMDGQILYVEVKGTTTDGGGVLLTPNEVVFARGHKDQMALYIVHGIQTSNREGQPIASGGAIRLIHPWDIDMGALQPLGFSYSVPR